MHVCKALILVGSISSLLFAESFPENCGVDFAYTTIADTTLVSISSDSVISEFILSDHAPISAVLLDCMIDGVTITVLTETEIDTAFVDSITTRFIVVQSFHSLRLTYICNSTLNQMSWTANCNGPVFGFIPEGAGPPKVLRWY